MDRKTQDNTKSPPTSERLKLKKEIVMKLWQDRVCKEIPAAKAQNNLELQNSIPKFLDKLCIALSAEKFTPYTSDEVNEVSKDHGEQRAGLPGYSLVQMLKEYQILREVIISTVETEGPITNVERDIILCSIEEGMVEASHYFELLSQRENTTSRIIIDGIRDHAIIRTDIHNIIVDWNAGAERIFGWKKPEVLGKSGSIIFTAEELANHADKEEVTTAAREGKAQDKRWHIKKDGSRFFANGIMNSLNDDEGKVFGFIKVLRDDTERLIIEEEKERAQKLITAAQNAAHSNLKQLHDFFTQSPTPMAILEGPNYLFRLANAPYEKMVGRKVVGKTVLEAFTMEEIKHFIPFLDKVYQSGNPHIGREQPLNIPNEAGVIEEHWVNVNYFPHYDENGRVKGILCDVHEVTDQVQIRRLVQESESKFRQIANTLPNILWTARPDGFIDWHSDKYSEYTGMSAMTKFESQGSPLHPDDVKKTAEKWRDSVDTGKDFEIEHRIKCKITGDYRWNLAKGTPLKDDKGNIIKWVGSTTDIHDLKLAQEAIHRSEELFRTLANSLPQIIWTATPEGFVDWYNEWWNKYLGMPIGTMWDDAKSSPMHPEDVKRTLPLWEESLTTGKPFNMEQRFRRGSDGQYRWHLVRGVPIKDSLGKITKWIGANTDIHDHKILVQTLEEERELREKFVAALSHDLRTPLTSAKLSAQVLRKSYSHDEKVLRTSDRIVGHIDRVDAMIKDLLDASRLSAGETLPLECEDADLLEIVHSTIEELRHLHGNHFKIVEDISRIEGKWDVSGIQRILENLCINAVKYGDTNVPITIRVGRSSKGMAMLSVQNAGKPIPPEDQVNLFQPFKRAAGAQASGKKGWGIGLMLVKGIIDAHAGSIEVSSSESEGTTFTVMLPLKGGCP